LLRKKEEMHRKLASREGDEGFFYGCLLLDTVNYVFRTV